MECATTSMMMDESDQSTITDHECGDLQSSVTDQYKTILNQVQTQLNPEARQAVPWDSRTSDQVFISIPSVYVNVDETRDDRISPNLFIIDYIKFCELMTFATKIEKEINDEHIMYDLINRLQNKDQTTQMIVESLMSMSQLQQSLDIEDEFIDTSLKVIEFDSFRHYENDPDTGLLIDINTNVRHFECSFYTELGARDDLVQKVRELTNDTDLNRMYYILKMFEASLLFQPDRVAGQLKSYMTYALFFMLLKEASSPVIGHHCNDIDTNLVGLITDAFARSRIITHWKNSNCRNQMLKEIGTNYPKDNFIVRACQLDTPLERAQYATDFLSKQELVARFAKAISYKQYIKILETTVLSIDNEHYYMLNSDFLTKIISVEGVLELIKHTSQFSP